jgi:hypothetical protein
MGGGRPARHRLDRPPADALAVTLAELTRAPAAPAAGSADGVGVHDASVALDAMVWRGREMPLQSQAQHRTRTDDPFLTMEVLYQLS